MGKDNENLDNLEDDTSTVVEGTDSTSVSDSKPATRELADVIPDNIAEKKPSIRDSIKHALKKEVAKEDAAKTATKAKIFAEETEEDKDAAQVEESSTEKAVAAKIQVKPPVGWTKEAKQKWNELPPEVQQSVAKREQEVSDGFKKYGEDAGKYKELDSVLAPRREAIKSFGATEAQTIDRLFKWMESLSHPDKGFAKQQFLNLAKNFNIDLAAGQSDRKIEPVQEGEELPPALKNFMETVTGEVGNLKRVNEQQRAQAANDYVESWSKDKPHFQGVRQHMFALLQTGVVPLKAGQLDLDEAYNQAVYANPQIREKVVQEESAKATQIAEENRKKMEAARLAKLNKAKAAGSSISPRAPSGNVSQNNGKTNKSQSVRDTIKAAMQEVSEQ